MGGRDRRREAVCTPNPKDIRAYLESGPKKPFILCEYMHDMGNSLGGMESYIRLGEEFPQ